MGNEPSFATDAWMSRLNLKHLQQLRSLAEHGSISEAARSMATTQPALSKWLKELEDAIGAPLFERHARGLTPTAHGRVLLTHAARLGNETLRMQRDLAVLDGGGSVHVRVGVAPIAAPHLAPRSVAAFLRKHPQATVELHEHTMRVLLRKLEENELDIAVGSLDDFEAHPGVQHQVLHEERLQVVARKKHPLASRTALEWDDLRGYDWVLWPQGTINRARLDAALLGAGRGALPCHVESSSLVANLALVRQSDLLCAISDSLADHVAKRMDILPLDTRIGARSLVGMCWRDDPLQDAATGDMLQFLRNASA